MRASLLQLLHAHAPLCCSCSSKMLLQQSERERRRGARLEREAYTALVYSQSVSALMYQYMPAARGAQSGRERERGARLERELLLVY